MRERSCETRQFTFPGMTLLQHEAIRSIPRSSSHEERWFAMWDILFPGEPRPDSPYVDDPVEEMGRLYLQRLNQQQPGPSTTDSPTEYQEQAPGSNDTAPEREFGPEALTDMGAHLTNPRPSLWDNAVFELQNSSLVTSELQLGPSQEPGLRMRPSHSEPGFIGSPQLGPYRLGDQRGYYPPPDSATGFRPYDNGRRALDPNFTHQAPKEKDAQAQLSPSTTPYRIVPSTYIGLAPDHGLNLSDLPNFLEDSTVGDMEVHGLSRDISGSTIALDEGLEMMATPHFYPAGEHSFSVPWEQPIYLDEAPVETSKVSSDPSLGMPEKSQPPPHISRPQPQVDETGSSARGESSCRDSGYASRESRENAGGEDVDDNASIYSMESISPESRSRYITTFSNRLAQDICKLACESAIPEGSRKLLLEWIKTFALKLQGESITRTKREASVFIRKYRRYVEISPSPSFISRVTNISG